MTVPDTYYTPTGEAITREKIVQDMILNYQDTVTNLTDFSEGTENRNLLESIALSFFKSQFYTNFNLRESFTVYSDGGYLDLKGLENKVTRKTGTQAGGFITIELPEASEDDYVINDDIMFINPDTNLEYTIYMPLAQIEEDYEYTIPAGTTKAKIPVFCTENGTIGNCDRYEVNTFSEDLTVDNVICYNEEALTGGTDPESDDDYRARILQNEANDTFGSKNWYINLVNSIDGVHDTMVNYAGEQVCVYVNGETKPINSKYLTEAEALVNNDANHTLGHTFKVYEPDYNLIDLRVSVNTTDTLTSDTIKNRLTVLFDGGTNQNMTFFGYKMGETVKESEVINAVQSISGVTSCTPELMGNDGDYHRFSVIINQFNKVAVLNNVEVVFRED